MRKIEYLKDIDVAVKRKSASISFRPKEVVETKSQGVVFQGWKRYEEAEEEE